MNFKKLCPPVHADSETASDAASPAPRGWDRFFPQSTLGRMFNLVLLGALGGLAMGPFYIWPALVIALSGLWIITTSFAEDQRWKSFLCGWLFGMGFFTYSLYWIGNALLINGNPYKWAYPFALVGLPIFLSLYTGLAAYLSRRICKGRGAVSFCIFIALIMVAEYARGHLFSGFPWNLYGMSWTAILPMLQILSIGGIYFLSFLTVFMFAMPGFMIKGHAPPLVRILGGVAALAIGIGLYIFGTERLAHHPTELRQDTVVQLIQPNIAQSMKWDPEQKWENYRALLNVIRNDQTLTATGPHAARLLILPETSVTSNELSEPAALEALKGAMLHYKEPSYILAGALLGDREGYHNSLVVMDHDLRLKYKFDKFHLVPFGEYMPMQKYIPFGPLNNFSGFTAGPGPQTAMVDDIPPFSPLVCYEVIFPGEVTSTNPKRAEWIVNVSNDAWYGISPGPFQHMSHAIYRAIETGLPVVRGTNTGLSVVVDPYGRVISSLPLMVAGSVDSFLPRPAAKPTLYSRFEEF